MDEYTISNYEVSWLFEPIMGGFFIQLSKIENDGAVAFNVITKQMYHVSYDEDRLTPLFDETGRPLLWNDSYFEMLNKFYKEFKIELTEDEENIQLVKVPNFYSLKPKFKNDLQVSSNPFTTNEETGTSATAVKKITCSHCQHEVEDNDNYCKFCGNNLWNNKV